MDFKSCLINKSLYLVHLNSPAGFQVQWSCFLYCLENSSEGLIKSGLLSLWQLTPGLQEGFWVPLRTPTILHKGFQACFVEERWPPKQLGEGVYFSTWDGEQFTSLLRQAPFSGAGPGPVAASEQSLGACYGTGFKLEGLIFGCWMNQKYFS